MNLKNIRIQIKCRLFVKIKLKIEMYNVCI